MFMLRCGFWLSVMVASLPIGSGLVRDWHGTGDAVTAGIADAAAARTGAWCVGRAGQCVRDAARLNALVAAIATRSEAGETARDDLRDAAPREPARHRAAGTMLTDRR